MKREGDSTRMAVRRHAWRCAAVLLASVLLRPATAAEQPEATTAPRAGHAPVVLKLANRDIVTFRAEVFGAGPADRRIAVEERIGSVIENGGPLTVETRPIAEGAAVLIDGRPIFRVLNGDVNPETGETVPEAANRAAANLQRALDEMRESRDSRLLLRAAGWALVATGVLFAALWILLRAYGWLARRVAALAEERARRLADKLGSTAGQQVLGQIGVARVALAPVRLLAVLIGMLMTYEWAGVVLKQFPYTRPWGESLLGNLLYELGRFAWRALEALPGLLFVLLIYFIARFVVRTIRLFFAGVEEGRIQMAWVDETTARPTGRLLGWLVWLLALVAAYPYIPGSESEAFKGVGVFVGLMLSIGSSGVVNQAVSGIMLMYTRPLRLGEYVQVGDTEGTVREIGFLTTTIETTRHEHVTVPNNVIVGSVSRNYSRLKQEGVRFATTVTIGYDTSWRQVHAMLALAAERSARILKDPPPNIRQTGLLDHAVEYTLLVCLPEAAKKPEAMNELHANIQDVFNEYGVQIMSPRYEADAPQAKVVPREEWFKAPARPGDTAGG